MFPLCETILIQYVCMLARSIRHDSIKTYLSGIQFSAIRAGFDRTIPPMQRLFYVMRGIRRFQAFHSRQPPKKPILVNQLRDLFTFVSRKYSAFDRSMLRTAMAFAFFGMLRASEYTVSHTSHFTPNSTLLCEDISLVVDCIHIFIKSSKTDPFRSGVSIRIGRTGGGCCPVAAFASFRALRSRWTGPLCSFADGSFLTRQRLSSILQECFPGVNINTHSFRIGGASAAAAAGIPDSTIQILGRWSSDAFLRYLRFDDVHIVSFSSSMASVVSSL